MLLVTDRSFGSAEINRALVQLDKPLSRVLVHRNDRGPYLAVREGVLRRFEALGVIIVSIKPNRAKSGVTRNVKGIGGKILMPNGTSRMILRLGQPQHVRLRSEARNDSAEIAARQARSEGLSNAC
jgi:hypothetical protein